MNSLAGMHGSYFLYVDQQIPAETSFSHKSFHWSAVMLYSNI